MRQSVTRRAATFLLAAGLLCGAAPLEAADYSHVIRQAYLDILRREADPGGLAHYNELMNAAIPLTEAGLREALMRSAEYAQRFPNPSPTPTPPPPGAMLPLRTLGNQFAAGGQARKLLGTILCCCSEPLCPTPLNEATARGWPATVDEATLNEYAAARNNYVHVRTGPFRLARPGEDDSGETAANVAYADAGGGRVDLNRWNETFWSNLDAFLARAEARGIYVELDLVDVWVLDHEVGPWSAASNVNGVDAGSISVVHAAPQPVHERWVREVVRRTRHRPNVIYQDGNEAWKGSQPAWVHRLRDVVREETSADRSSPAYRLFGSNSGRTREVDYLTIHEDHAVDPDPELPVIVNEYPSRSTTHVLINAKTGWDRGAAFMYWRGGHTWDETRSVLQGMKTITEGGNPVEIPATCPWLVRWRLAIHNMMDGAFRPVDRPTPGGYVVYDSTPCYGAADETRGRPCNDEHNEACGGRPCEDPRGGVWMVNGASCTPPLCRTMEHGYQVRVGPLPGSGSFTVRVRALGDAHDALGVPLRVRPDHPRESTFVVGVVPGAAALAREHP